MMDHLRGIAFEVVARACGFGSLAIFCMMVGFSFAPRRAFQAGGLMCMFMTLVLVLKAYEARTRDYRKTEIWLYLSKENRPPHNFAQTAVSTVMRETYLTFARWSAITSIVMWVIALLFALVPE